MWRSAQGLRPYARASMLTGIETSFALYDMLYMTIDYLKWFYMSPNVLHHVAQHNAQNGAPLRVCLPSFPIAL